LAGTWLDEAGGPKTPNYAGNFSGRTLEATIDGWIAQCMRRLAYKGQRAWRIQPASETGVSDLDFAFGQKVFRVAAKELHMSPDDLQAVCWMGETWLAVQNGWAEGGASADLGSYDEPFRIAFEGDHPLDYESTRRALSNDPDEPKPAKRSKPNGLPEGLPGPLERRGNGEGVPDLPSPGRKQRLRPGGGRTPGGASEEEGPPAKPEGLASFLPDAAPAMPVAHAHLHLHFHGMPAPMPQREKARHAQ
jgi:hypothetical protein